jgi:hypothetical protein
MNPEPRWALTEGRKSNGTPPAYVDRLSVERMGRRFEMGFQDTRYYKVTTGHALKSGFHTAVLRIIWTRQKPRAGDK